MERSSTKNDEDDDDTMEKTKKPRERKKFKDTKCVHITKDQVQNIVFFVIHIHTYVELVLLKESVKDGDTEREGGRQTNEIHKMLIAKL